MSDPVTLHPRLQRDTGPVADIGDCWLRWMNDRRFPWLVVVPRVADVREWHQLSSLHQHALLDTVNHCAERLQAITGADKMNVAALGNMVPQLHVHVIARFVGDDCWPGPVWGQGEPRPWPDNSEPDWLPALREAVMQNGR